LIKAMLVHTADWEDDAYGVLSGALRTDANKTTFKDHASAFLGYGILRPERALSCTARRATFLGGGVIGEGETWAHRIPLIDELHTFDGWRRLTITLAWFTPVNPAHQGYRRAALSFSSPKNNDSPLRVTNQQVHANAVGRGTVQHEVLGRASGAIALIPGREHLSIPVTCSADAGELSDRVPYALAVSLELAAEVKIELYDKIRERVRVQA
jgi:hypothetical protein